MNDESTMLAAARFDFFFHSSPSFMSCHYIGGGRIDHMLRSRFGESENLGAFSPHPSEKGAWQGTALQLFSMVVGQIYEVSGRLFLGPGSYHTIPVIP